MPKTVSSKFDDIVPRASIWQVIHTLGTCSLPSQQNEEAQYYNFAVIYGMELD